MEILIGFAVGYYVGSQAGRDGIARLQTAVTEIRTSEEFQALQASALAMAGQYLRSAARGGGDPRRDLVRSLVGEAAGVVQRRLQAAA